MIIAIDTGGTKTLIECFDAHGNKTFIDKFPTPLDTHDYITQVVAAIPTSDTIEAIILAVPGIVEGGVISLMGNLPWRDFDVRTALQQHFPDTPVYVDNDANLGGLGEVRVREDVPSRCLYITVSTGIGGGFIVDGHIDPVLAATEMGHMCLEHDGHLQRWEHFASGKALKNTLGKMASEITDARDWEMIAENISKGLLVLLPTLRPQLVIIGGSVGTYFENYSQTLADILEHNLEPLYVCPLTSADQPEKAVIYGCYHYALDQLARR